jgi:short-subunit dehydrogenase
MANKRKILIVPGTSQGIGAGDMKAFPDRGYNLDANSRISLLTQRRRRHA